MINLEIEVINSKGVKTGKVYIDHENILNISINYRYELYPEDFDWQGHYRCEIINSQIVEEFIRADAKLEIVVETISNCLEKCKNIELVNSIKNAYSNRKTTPTIF